MKVLFIAPIPPPITGQSLASLAFLDALRRDHSLKVINLQKEKLKQGVTSFGRIVKVSKLIRNILEQKAEADVIYLTISQSVPGNIKDLLIYLVCFSRLSKMVIHLHGGGIRKIIFDKHPLLRWVNAFFLKRVAVVIVLGESLAPIFREMVRKEKIYVVPNFADDDLFSPKEVVTRKYEKTYPLKVLFLSNLIPGKGHEELLSAYKVLGKNTQEKMAIEFAGDFESEEQKKTFLEKIVGEKGISYHGVVSGNDKKQLLADAHVFCLPTYYPFEGQPISILEAYAAGCVVITTDHGGISDIFTDGWNGYFVEKKSSSSICRMLKKLADMREQELLDIAIHNRTTAGEKYKADRYVYQMTDILENLYRGKKQFL